MTDRGLVKAAAETISKGSKSFAAAARLFDPPTRESAILLYAWCRHCDDVIDGQVLGHRVSAADGAADRLAELEVQTRSALAGEPQSEPAFAGLQAVVQRHAIPERYPLQHLAGFRMDVEGRRYETIEDTLDYAYHVAGVVGVMMGHLMGVREPSVLDRAADLGIAFQLTNIGRDIVEDAAVGRVYLPGSWLREAGIPAEEVGARQHRDSLARVTSRLLAEAEPYYRSAAIGIEALPFRAAWAIATALGVYRQIGLDVRAKGARAWDGRVATSAGQKAAHIVRGLGVAAMPRRSTTVPVRSGLYARPA